MSKWQIGRLISASILLIVGLPLLSVAMYFWYLYVFPENGTHYQDHTLAIWAFLMNSFIVLFTSASFAFTLKRVISKRLLKVFYLPAVASGFLLALFSVLPN
jgi:hypothetical protein